MGHVNKVKIIPRFVEEYLSPIALAILIMDDGLWQKDRGIRLATNCFSLSDVKYLASILETKYNIKVSFCFRLRFLPFEKEGKRKSKSI